MATIVKPHPQTISTTTHAPAQHPTVKAKPKPVVKKVAAKPKAKTTVKAKPITSVGTPNTLYGGNDLISQLLGAAQGTQTPQSFADAELAALQKQTDWQNTQMQNAAKAAETAGANWSNQSAANLTNLAGLVGSPVATNTGSMGDVPANIAALPGVMSQQELLRAVSGAAHAENQSGMIPGQIAQSALQDQGLLYGSQSKAQAVILDALSKNQTTQSDSQLSAASRILAAQLSAGGAVTRNNATVAASTANNIRTTTTSATNSANSTAGANARAGATASAKQLTDARAAETAAWSGQNASAAHGKIPPATSAQQLLSAVSNYGLSPDQIIGVLQAQGHLTAGQIQDLKWANPQLRNVGGYAAQVKAANSYAATVQKTLASNPTMRAHQVQIAAVQKQISQAQAAANKATGFAGPAARAQVVALQSHLAQLEKISPIPIATIVGAAHRFAPLGAAGATQMMAHVFGANWHTMPGVEAALKAAGLA